MGGKHTRRSPAAEAAKAADARRGRARDAGVVVRGVVVDVAPERVARIGSLLHQTWGEAACELEHEGPFQLLVAEMLVTQSRPGVVDRISPALFARYPDAHALAQAERNELEALIRDTGFYRYKAAALCKMARMLVTRHQGEVPRTLGELMRLPGVTRRIANAVLGTCFGLAPGFMVDANVLRVARRLGLTDAVEALGAERDLMAVFPRERWIDLGNELSWLGRRVCRPREPACHTCALAPVCPNAVIDPRPYPWGHGS